MMAEAEPGSGACGDGSILMRWLLSEALTPSVGRPVLGAQVVPTGRLREKASDVWTMSNKLIWRSLWSRDSGRERETFFL